MATFKWNCPQADCRAQEVAFVSNAAWYNDRNRKTYMWAICPICKVPAVFVIITENHGNAAPGLLNYGGDPFESAGALHMRQQGAPGAKIETTVPLPPVAQVPEHVPANVGQPFLEGLKARDVGMLPSAVYNLRKALERTVRQQDPTGTGMLKARIKRLAEAQKIPPTLVDLAHTVRAEGNVEVHEEEDWTLPQVQELIDFTVLLLTYVYSLPVRIAAIAEHRGAPPAER